MTDLGVSGGFLHDLGQIGIGAIRQRVIPSYVGRTGAFPVATTPQPVTVIPGTGGMVPPSIPVSCDGGPAPVYKKVNGVYQWVKQRRRRRKKLLRESDARGLAQLKGIVGNGKVMEVWIATHGG